MMMMMKKFTVKPKLTHAKHLLVGNGDSKHGEVFVGRLAESGQIVKIDLDTSRPHVISIFGKRGSGKSYTLGSILEGLCTKKQQSSISTATVKWAALLFDTLGIFQWLDVPLSLESSRDIIKEQAEAQKGWDVENESLNVEIWTPMGTTSASGPRKEFTINCADFTASDWGDLLGIDTLQDRMGQLLAEAHDKVVLEGWSEDSTSHAPIGRYAVENLMKCIEMDTEIGENYHRETRRALIQQLSVYRRNSLFQPTGLITAHSRESDKDRTAEDESARASGPMEGTPLKHLLKSGQLSVILLHKLPDELRYVVIVSLIRKIMQARIETSEREKNLRISSNLDDVKKKEVEKEISEGVPPVWIAADEAQNFLPSEKKTTATDILVRLVREGRNFGLSFILTTQQPSAVDQRILAQVDTVMCHKLTVQSDIEYVKRNLKSSLPEEVRFGNTVLSFEALMRSLDVGQAVVSNTEANRTFIMNIRPRVSVHGGFGI